MARRGRRFHLVTDSAGTHLVMGPRTAVVEPPVPEWRAVSGAGPIVEQLEGLGLSVAHWPGTTTENGEVVVLTPKGEAIGLVHKVGSAFAVDWY